jgi:tagaturonate reductase
MEKGNYFCNSLVDRIVPGALPPGEKEETFRYLGYEDELMIMTESFGLWAIESSDTVASEILSFASVDKGVVIAPGIEKFRELKLRLLNGTHTFSCGLAHLAGFATVKEAMDNEVMANYIEKVCTREIVTAITGDLIPQADAREFANQVLDRFRNPFLDHKWTSICVQYTSKMKMRNIPLIIKYLNKTGRVPGYMALGFAAYLLYMKCTAANNGQFSGNSNGKNYQVQDDHAGFLEKSWSIGDPATVVNEVLSGSDFWGFDLSAFGAFSEAVKNYLDSLITNGIISTMGSVQLDSTTA